MSRQPRLGAVVRGGVTHFRVWAPAAATVDVVIVRSGEPPITCSLTRSDDGTFAVERRDAPAGSRYGYLVDGAGPWPDPASRWQPDGVHGLSMVVDPATYAWSDEAWKGVALPDLVLYELHTGTFTNAGTFAGVADRLAYLGELGVTAIELMPVADFPGRWNWGYDGVALFAPSRAYGSPDDLRRLVDRAHQLGLAVILDVVYNHTGPDGSALPAFSPFYFSARHRSPWGVGLNFDGGHGRLVREFFIENAVHWIHEYHMDGLRLDATHAMIDESATHFVQELADAVRATETGGRPIHVMAEDHRNLATMVAPKPRGWGLDAVWADDFHHQMRRLLAGDADGYYEDYSGAIDDVATTLRQGWFYTGQHSRHLNGPRGTDPSGLCPSSFIVCLQNHDQVGNRAFGERLNHQIELSAYRAASVLLMVLPHTPLLFMGQEWAASTPFLYFTDHAPALGQLVTEGRRREFRAFEGFADEASRARIPDPQAIATAERSRLDWSEQMREPHAGILRLYRTALGFRHRELAPLEAATTVDVMDADTLAVRRTNRHGAPILIVVRLKGSGDVVLGHPAGPSLEWTLEFTSEDAPFTQHPVPPGLEGLEGVATVRFLGPAAVVLTGRQQPAQQIDSGSRRPRERDQ